MDSPSGTDSEAHRIRDAAVAAAVMVAGAGLELRTVVEGDVVKYGRGALYTVLIVSPSWCW
ncbi:hypothetical protein [Streptomyces viridosporus]|uniref:hypothetical protein n=1 Tax=Streptomyces viridosporus TaxID=67581 RepID=UPI0001AEEF61